jgi:pimeloyl-ACP methyl ester carboxylesterase
MELTSVPIILASLFVLSLISLSPSNAVTDERESWTIHNDTSIGYRLLYPNSELLNEDGDLKNDISSLAKLDSAHLRKGTIADGVSKLVLILNSNSTLRFSIADTTPDNLTNGTLTSLGQSPNSINLSSATIVHPQRISDGNSTVAVAVYTPPNFIEPPNNNSYTTINILVNDTRYQPIPLELYRVPVVLVHGLWGDPQETWIKNKFDEALKQSRFDVYFADYSDHNADTFDPYFSNIGNYGIDSIRKQITKVIEKYSNRSIAASQVDVVAHSMGGLMARGFVQQPDYKGPENFQKGSMHRLITIGTPHFGGDLSRILFEHRNQEYCVSGTRLSPVGKDGNCKSGEEGPMDLKTIYNNWTWSIVQGGVESLIPGSNAYNRLCQTDVKSYAIAGVWKPDAKDSKKIYENFYKNVTGNENFDLDNDGFHDQNDLVVGLTSQLGGLVYNRTQQLGEDIIPFNSTIYPNTVHTTSYIKGNDVGVSSELNSTQIQQRVIKLLGSLDGNKKFADAIGIGSPCNIP